MIAKNYFDFEFCQIEKQKKKGCAA